jgi:hypothetical protein
LGVSPEAVRAKAARKRWRRQVGNDGLARVWLPGDLTMTTRAREPGDQPVTPRSSPGRKVATPDNIPLIKALEAHVATLKEQLTQRDAQLAAEQAKTERAIEAFGALADRLDALAAERRPWWRRLVG